MRKLLMFSIYRLCEHPEYIKPLTNEVENMLKLPEADHYKHVPLMESFLREAARFDPLDSCRSPKFLCWSENDLTASSVCPTKGFERFHILGWKLRTSGQRDMRATAGGNEGCKILRKS